MNGLIEAIRYWMDANGGPLLQIGLRLGIGLAVGILAHLVVYWIGSRFSKRSDTIVDNRILGHLRKPSRMLFPVVAMLLAIQGVELPPALSPGLLILIRLSVIIAVAWTVIASWHVFEAIILKRHNVDVEDNLEARRIHTQFSVLRRLFGGAVGVVAFAAGLMLFPGVRQIGASVLASAGIAGLVLGIAARPALSNLIAGIQIALAQPIRLDDVVIVEGEWGRIEEITQTYVVVRIWDLRRLIVPLNYFLEHPFENWTRTSASLLGTVFIYVDYTIPVEAVRQELKRILDESGMWDGKVRVLQVTNATEHTVELRALMSARDASRAFELRCHVREKLIDYLQRNWPGSLPRVRAQLDRADTRDQAE